MTCQDCRHFQKLDRPCSGEAGYCRIHPPVHAVALGRWGWPVVEGDEDWCGELAPGPDRSQFFGLDAQPTGNAATARFGNEDLLRQLRELQETAEEVSL